MRLWRVKVVFDEVVRAEDEASAKEAAIEAHDDILYDTSPVIPEVAAVESLRDLPPGWTGDCRPWGKRDPYDRTIEQQLDALKPAG